MLHSVRSQAELSFHKQRATELMKYYSELTQDHAADCLRLDSGKTIGYALTDGSSLDRVKQVELYASVASHQERPSQLAGKHFSRQLGEDIYRVCIVANPFDTFKTLEGHTWRRGQFKDAGRWAYSLETCSCPEQFRWTHEYLKDVELWCMDLNFRWAFHKNFNGYLR